MEVTKRHGELRSAIMLALIFAEIKLALQMVGIRIALHKV